MPLFRTSGLPLAVLFGLAACGVDETSFIPDYADAYCQTVMDCSDPAVLVFDGVESIDDCLAMVGPAIEDQVNRCDYDPKQAKKCLKAMDGMGCPGEGQSVDDILPLDCSTVSTLCSAPKTDTPTTGTTVTTTTGGGTGG